MAKRKSKLMFPVGSQMPEWKEGGGEPHMQTHFPLSTHLGEKDKDRPRVNNNEDSSRRKKAKRFSCKNTELCFRGEKKYFISWVFSWESCKFSLRKTDLIKPETSQP